MEALDFRREGLPVQQCVGIVDMMAVGLLVRLPARFVLELEKQATAFAQGVGAP
jgi:hypothetical protein